MATLVRDKIKAETERSESDILSTIPSPFPVDQLERDHTSEGQIEHDGNSGQKHMANLGAVELMPSIAQVEKTCLMTLSNLLSTTSRPLLPHDSSETASLHTLISNLRSRDHHAPLPLPADASNTALVQELNETLDSLSAELDPSDASLARTLASLLSHLDQLASLHDTPLSSSHSWSPPDSGDVYTALTRQVSDFQSERLASQQRLDQRPDTPKSPVYAVETELLWLKIDDELETVAFMCKQRTERLPRFSVEGLPPQYDLGDYDVDSLPEYERGSRDSYDDSKSERNISAPSSATTVVSSEKLRLDFEAVTTAIERLYLVAPQLHDQRVELKDAKVRQMQKASLQGKGKEKERDDRDLDFMMNLIDKASSRSLKDQSVVVEDMDARIQRATQRVQAKHEAFVDQLAEHSGSGRLRDQDAEFQPPRQKDPEAMLTLPEFIREMVPSGTQSKTSSRPTSSSSASGQSVSRINSLKSKRDRSLSAPPLAWFRSHSRSGSTTPGPESKTASPPAVAFEVQHVAEFHENLQHIIVFLVVSGAHPNTELEAEVVAVDGEPERLVIRSGPMTSPHLPLPARVPPGKKEIQNLGGHLEIKMGTARSLDGPMNVSSSSTDPIPLLDATQLMGARPTGFACSSCSLPLVQSSKIGTYQDLPSEHWEELVDAWMCHGDQKLHDQVMKRGRDGFWPTSKQALVGASYLLFDESAMVKTNIGQRDQTSLQEKWRIIRCLCGATIGRCQTRISPGTNEGIDVYRVLKYTIHPVVSGTELRKIPLSAYIIEDMTEYVRAHATYRFVVHDEEEEKPRILLWLFKPSLHLTYSKSAAYVIPRSGDTHGAKVLYTLLSPADASADLKTYPGFPQAELLYYPMNACRVLAGLLKESNQAYPERLRTMTGLEVGWLSRY